ncbi:MAG: hypothetical protein HY329_10065 [Chloroflexi bacterium]|nr:hypothetical protein [Chloroflexota bacterium]
MRADTVAEISGKDSIAAALFAATREDVRVIVPSIVTAPTEYGDHGALLRNVEFLRAEVAERYRKIVLEPVVDCWPELWGALNGAFAGELQDRFDFYSPCPGCHLYFHLMRLPVARHFGATKIISGERERHGRRIKLNQVSEALDLYQQTLARTGIELLIPLREIESDADVLAILGPRWHGGVDQLRCVFSGNYVLVDGKVPYPSTEYRAYLREYLADVAPELARRIDAGHRHGFRDLVGQRLRAGRTDSIG